MKVPTNALLYHCRGYRSTSCVIDILARLQDAWLQRAQHGDALALPSVSGVVRSLGKRTRGCIIVPEAGGPCRAHKPRRLLENRPAGSGCPQIAPIYLRVPSQRRHADWRVKHSTAAVCMLPLEGKGQQSSGNNGLRLQYRSVPAAARTCMRRWSDCCSVIALSPVEAVNLLRNGNGCTVV